jgi:hypothetical protein
MEITVRECVPEDRAATVALGAASGPCARQPAAELAESYVAVLEDWRAAQPAEVILLVAVAGEGRVVGFASCCERVDPIAVDGRDLCLHDVVVRRAEPERPVLAALVLSACHLATRQGVGRIGVPVAAMASLAPAAGEPA